jgi:hypothetical protein
VFTPRARYVNGRPDWLTLGGQRKAYRFDLKKILLQSDERKLKAATPVLVQAFVRGESPDAIPIDQMILFPGKEIPVLMLPQGAFDIRAVDEKGKVIGQYQIKRE